MTWIRFFCQEGNGGESKLYKNIRSGAQTLGTFKISDTTIILQHKRRHYCYVLNFMFEMPLGTLTTKYGKIKDTILAFFWVSSFIRLFWPVFGGTWGPLCCIGCHWTAIGAPLVTFRGAWGRPWSVIGLHRSPLKVQSDTFWCHWKHFGRHFAISATHESILASHLSCFCWEENASWSIQSVRKPNY